MPRCILLKVGNDDDSIRGVDVDQPDSGSTQLVNDADASSKPLLQQETQFYSIDRQSLIFSTTHILNNATH